MGLFEIARIKDNEDSIGMIDARCNDQQKEIDRLKAEVEELKLAVQELSDTVSGLKKELEFRK